VLVCRLGWDLRRFGEGRSLEELGMLTAEEVVFSLAGEIGTTSPGVEDDVVVILVSMERLVVGEVAVSAEEQETCLD
jgi:hypothetical protein